MSTVTYCGGCNSPLALDEIQHIHDELAYCEDCMEGD